MDPIDRVTEIEGAGAERIGLFDAEKQGSGETLRRRR